MSNRYFETGIVMIGAGNVATHLAQAIDAQKIPIINVYSKTKHSAQQLANKLNTDYTTDINKIPAKADLYIIAVSDSAIASIVQNLEAQNKTVVHTAGSISIDVFKGFSQNYGVFYPLQTFTKNRTIDFSNIPICIETNNSLLEQKLTYLANSLSNNVYKIDSQKRKTLHLAAVFACNFANHMFSIASDILKQNNIDTNLLNSLINETAQKAIDLSPLKAQTGPAIRNDKDVIKNHLQMLKDRQEFEKIYRFVSDSIFNYNQEK
ncbi:MAG: DUF2520 domain-containing protein [Bacteroidales bacterium]|nr:DUF2520 domain-containing protein [Bacteroidales bacterium]